MFIGRKFFQPLGAAHRVDFREKVVEVREQYVRVQLTAASGPLGTRDYRLLVGAVPVDERRSFVHVSYAYTHGSLARRAIQLYLATFARGRWGSARRVGVTANRHT